MAEFTPNYQLHQWEPTDPFLREDFNQDFEKIDTSLGRAERSAEANAYNVYNLMLQNDYEGKYTGYKKALIFDGFQDSADVASLTKGLSVDTPNRSLFLDSSGQGDYDRGLGHDAGGELRTYREANVTMTGNGTLTAMEIYCGGEVRFELYDGDELLASCQKVIEAEITELGYFPMTAELVAGKTYRVRLVNCEDRDITIGYARSCSDGFGFRMRITPLRVTQGTMTSRSWALEPPVSGALAWVRHTSGTVDLRLGGVDMTRTGQCSTRTLDNKSCVETAFSLDQSLEGNSVAVQLTLNGSNLRVYDYGIVLK